MLKRKLFCLATPYNYNQIFKMASTLNCTDRNLQVTTVISSSTGNEMMDDLQEKKDCEEKNISSITKPVLLPSMDKGEITEISESTVSQLSKRAQKKLRRKEYMKEKRKAKNAAALTKNSCPGFNSNMFNATEYYFENGLRKVYPYPFTFSSFAKERWFGRSLGDVFEKEFKVDSPDSVTTLGYAVNGKPVGLDYTIKNGDLLENKIHRHETPVSGAPIEIIEDTPELVVINKPSSIPCHPCGKYRFNSIVFIMGKELKYANLRNIYRLDRLTSGVLIMGKTAKKTKQLEMQILRRQVQKEYMARVVGEFPQGEIEVDQPLDCLSHKLTLWRVKKGGKPSRTAFQRVSYNGKTSLVRCRPYTGRTHQIRVHLQFLGHPILNDPYYNSPSWGPSRGKNGHSDIPLEELCSRIMKEHNVGLWLDGENPLSTDKLAASNATSPTSTQDKTAAEDNETESPETVDSKLVSNTGQSSELVDCCDTEEARPSKRNSEEHSCQPPKRTRLCSESLEESDQTIAEKEENGSNATCSIGDLPSEDCEASEEKSCLAVASGSSTSTDMNKEEMAADPDSSSSALDQNSERKGVPGVERNGFDPELRTPDPACQSCRLKFIDPKPTDLILYLHAYKYKGPSWEYTAKLPDWAADDWVEPPEYDKYLS